MFVFFKQKTAYEMRISDWSSDVCSSDLIGASNYSAERLAKALAISEAEGLARYTVLQPEYNLMVRDRFEGDLQKLCIEEGLGVLPYFEIGRASCRERVCTYV